VVVPRIKSSSTPTAQLVRAGARMFLLDMEGHAPSWPSTARDVGGPRSVVAVFGAGDSMGHRQKRYGRDRSASLHNTIWLRPSTARDVGGPRSVVAAFGAGDSIGHLRKR